jgi:beta-1,4-N-acetylglucosaminyltransferase
MKILLTFGGGGHTAETLRILRLLGPGYEYHYLILESEHHIGEKMPFPGKIHEVKQPRRRDDSRFTVVWKVLCLGIRLFRLMRAVRPAAVVGCGPSLSVVAMWAGKLTGAKVIFIETAARVRSVSLSGRLVYPHADLFLVQWPEMTKILPRAEYCGRI